jgi:hypothetical protein
MRSQLGYSHHVAIPVCDGEEAEKDFLSLLKEAHEEFRPVGFYEEWLVVKIAEAMWRRRRATRCENGSIREAVIWKGHRDYDQVLKGLATDLNLLENAEAQLRGSGTLSQETYTKILPLVEEQKRSEHVNRRRSLDWMYKSVARIDWTELCPSVGAFFLRREGSDPFHASGGGVVVQG